MKNKFVKLFTGLALLTLFLLSNPAMVPANAAVNHKAIPQSVNSVTTTSSTSLTFNVNQQQDLIYHLDSVSNNGSNYLEVNNTDMYNNNYPIGRIVQGDNIAFNFHSADNNGTYDFVDGSVRGSQLQQDANVQYYFVNASDALYQDNAGPPLMYFVMPNQNYTQTELDYNTANFVVANTANTFSVYQYYTTGNGDGYINATWDKNTGIMQYYNYTQVVYPILALFRTSSTTQSSSSGNMSLVLSYQGSVDPGNFMPYFANRDPTMFYNLATVQVGTSTQLDFSAMNDSNGYGFIQQGQNAMVSLHTQLDMMSNGPSYQGELATLTGAVGIDSPFGNNNTNGGNNGGGPPGLMFILPVSSDAGWWSNISLELSVMGLNYVGQNSTTIAFTMSNPDYANNNLVVFNKVTGIMMYYNFQSVDFQLPDGTTGIFNLQFNLLSVYDMSKLYPYFAVNQGDQNKYHIDTLNFNGSSTIPADVGTFSQGQDFHIKLDSLSLINGPSANVTFSTVTGQAHANINYDIFNGMQDGPILFFPVIPVNSSTQMLDFFSDVFNYVAGAQVINNATTFGIKVDNLNIGMGLTINHLYVYWNKNDGLLQSYDFSASNPADSSQSIQMKLHYLGNSNGEVVFTGVSSSTSSGTSSSSSVSTISAPGFELIFLISGLVTITIITRKRKLN